MLDKDDYAGMISLYEKDSEGPRFFYLLTYQNHGGWEQNESASDTIHVTTDEGNLTDDLGEYLSSVALYAEAFRGLTDYFKRNERPVVICIVGDHAPSFINQMEANRVMSFEETELWKRAVPFVIWTNFDYENPDCTVLCSMTDLVPIMLSYTKMPLTPYYSQILAARSAVPVRTRFGINMDTEGNVFENDVEDSTNDELTQYYFMEYNGITASDDYCPNLFQISE